jgi:AraC family transcriptional regulator
MGRRGLHGPLLAQLAAALWRAVRELHEGAQTSTLIAQFAAQRRMLHRIRHYATPGAGGQRAAADGAAANPLPVRTLTPHQLHRVIACTQDQPHQDLSLDLLAEHTGLSRSHFARLFRQTTGHTPHQFVLCLHIAHAQRLHEAIALALAHVAAECGFADQSAYTRAFTRVLDMPPRVYRRKRANRPTARL